MQKISEISLRAFNDYQRYCIYKNIRSKITINFSVDVFHENHSSIIGEYQEKYPQFEYNFKGLDRIWKTGRVEYSDKFEYKIDPMIVRTVMGYLWVVNTLYVTAKGNYETVGDGMYFDMDKINMGSVFDNSLLDLLNQYGKVLMGTEEEFERLLYRARNN